MIYTNHYITLLNVPLRLLTYIIYNQSKALRKNTASPKSKCFHIH